MVFRYSNNPFDGSILNSSARRSEVPFMVNNLQMSLHSIICNFNLISMVDYDCEFTVYCYYLVFTYYKQVVHNSCNMVTRGFPDIYTLSPRACGPRALGVYIRQTTCAHVTI